MKTTIKAFLHWHKFEWSDEARFQLHPSSMASCGPEYVPIRELEIEVDVPDDFDPRPLQVAALRAERDKITAECEVKKNNIDEQIQRLLSIEHKPNLKSVA